MAPPIKRNASTPDHGNVDDAYLSAIEQAASSGQAGLQVLADLLVARPMDAVNLLQVVKRARESETRNRQRDAANARHKVHQEAKVFVRNIFDRSAQQYATKKDFVDAMVKEVRKRFSVEITEGQMSREWLPNWGTRHAAVRRPEAVVAYVNGQYIGKRGKLGLSR